MLKYQRLKEELSISGIITAYQYISHYWVMRWRALRMLDDTKFYDRYKKGETHAIALCTDSNNSYSHFDITMYDVLNILTQLKEQEDD